MSALSRGHISANAPAQSSDTDHADDNLRCKICAADVSEDLMAHAGELLCKSCWRDPRGNVCVECKVTRVHVNYAFVCGRCIGILSPTGIHITEKVATSLGHWGSHGITPAAEFKFGLDLGPGDKE